MATGQTLLDLMELVNQELQLQTNEGDVTRGLLALNVSQDYFETLAAVRKIKGGQTTEVATVSNTETTAFPTGFLRIDGLQLLTGAAGDVKADLERLQRTGGHAQGRGTPWQFTSMAGLGQPSAYWTQGSSIYWAPKPNGVYYVRVYGFQRQTDITASSTFAYDDAVMLPLASFAARIAAVGVGDPVGDITALANETFKAVLDALDEFNRDGGVNLTYTQHHST